METARSSFLYILPQNITMQYARIAFIVIIGVALPNQIKLGEMQLTLLTQLTESQLGALDALAQYED